MSIRSGSAVVPAAVALCCLGLTACTGSAEAGHPFASGTTGTPPAADVATGRRAEHIEAEAVTAAPKLPSGERLAQVAAARGNRRIELGRIHAGGLAVSVSCQGKGTLTVRVEPRGLSFPLACVPRELRTVYNELRLSEAHPSGTVSVTAPSTLSWSVTVGQ